MQVIAHRGTAAVQTQSHNRYTLQLNGIDGPTKEW